MTTPKLCGGHKGDRMIKCNRDQVKRFHIDLEREKDRVVRPGRSKTNAKIRDLIRWMSAGQSSLGGTSHPW
jgi:hypothetical protein